MTKRPLRRAVFRGVRGRCPSCGKGALMANYISPLPRCGACGEDLSAYRTADLAPYAVTFLIGLIFMPLAVFLSVTMEISAWMAGLLIVGTLAIALLLLPRVKGAAIGLLWAMDMRTP